MYNEALQYQQENCYEMTHTTTEKNGILNKLIMVKDWSLLLNHMK